MTAATMIGGQGRPKCDTCSLTGAVNDGYGKGQFIEPWEACRLLVDAEAALAAPLNETIEIAGPDRVPSARQ